LVRLKFFLTPESINRRKHGTLNFLGRRADKRRMAGEARPENNISGPEKRDAQERGIRLVPEESARRREEKFLSAGG
jgi:hypothetical protein